MQKDLNGFMNIRLKRDRRMHFEDDTKIFCVQNRKI